ncbi:MAG: hypothetical protein IJT41_03485 [Clostridia bacterium]|nr:hypothetical protein [Clostridia bacterium]
MKQATAWIIAVILAMGLLWPAKAAPESRVYAQAAAGTPGSDIAVPIRIERNSGLMGFKLTFAYDSDVLTPVSVQKGEVTQSGMLDDSIRVSSPGSFEVIWSHSADVKTDGVLMTLVFRSAQTVPDSTEIQISFSRPDTFNEKWEDVPLTCEPIRISFADGAAPATDGTPAAVTQDDVLYAVDAALEAQGAQTITQVKDKDAFVKTVNEKVQAATGNADYFSGADALTDAYAQAAAQTYLDRVQQQVDGDKILLSIDHALTEVGAKTVGEVPAGKRAEFVQAVEAQLAQYMPDAPRLAGRVDTQTAMDTLDALQTQVAQDVDDSVPAPVEDHVVNHAMVVSLCVCAAAILAAGIPAAIHIKKKKSKNKEESQE